ncbi:MAG: MgtC/SapB family protein [Mogibacterium sp.]|nr:MgtC/SapB family protein [Mogibacterium sp.]
MVDYLPFLADPNILSIFIRAILAILCAGLIGYDRNTRGADAGIRTHILVCLGAMIAMSTGQFAVLYFDSGDITRIGAQVVSGIGFLGAGSIIITRSNHISGLTTAAGLWASACIGLAIGVGFYEGALIGTIAVYFTERWLRKWSKSIRANQNDTKTDFYNN